MNTDKLKNYKFDAAGFHTIECLYDGKTEVESFPDQVENAVTATIRKKRNVQGYWTKLQINPGKFYGEHYVITKSSELTHALKIIENAYDLDDGTIHRADFRMDSYDDEYYKTYLKANRLIVVLLCYSEGIENDYFSKGIMNPDKAKTLCAKSNRKHIQIECYDKALESGGRDPARTRLEIRTTSLPSNDLKHEFTVIWRRRLEKAESNMWPALKYINDIMEQTYRNEKNAFPVKFRSMTEFVMQRQDHFFTRKQLIDFCSRFPEDIKNPEEFAKNYKRRYGIEYFSQKDVHQIITTILESIDGFFAD